MADKQEQLYKVIEEVAKVLYGAPEDSLWEALMEEHKQHYRSRANAILSLKYPNGQPMVAALDEDQEPFLLWRETKPGDISESRRLQAKQRTAMGQLIQQGYRRTLEAPVEKKGTEETPTEETPTEKKSTKETLAESE